MAKKRRGKSSGSSSIASRMLMAAGYGLVRQPIAQVVTPFVAGVLPLGNLTDNVAMATIAYGAKKFIGNGTISKIADAALIVEAFEASAGMGMLSNLGIGNASASGNAF